jgi:hypothetical protein
MSDPASYDTEKTKAAAKEADIYSLEVSEDLVEKCTKRLEELVISNNDRVALSGIDLVTKRVQIVDTAKRLDAGRPTHRLEVQAGEDPFERLQAELGIADDHRLEAQEGTQETDPAD